MNVGLLESYEKNISRFFRKDKDNVILEGTPDEKPVYYSRNTMVGKIGLMCPKCFNYVIRFVNQKAFTMIENDIPSDNDNVELMMLTDVHYIMRQCPKCGAEEINPIEVDVNIVDSISKLNKKGYITNFCCEGHGIYDGYIYFKHRSILRHMNTLPLTWNLDLMDIRQNNYVIIRSDQYNYIESLIDLNEWVESLPDLTSFGDLQIPPKMVDELLEYSNPDYCQHKPYIPYTIPQTPIILDEIKPLTATETMEKIHIELMKKRLNSSIYGLLRIYGNYD